MADIDSDLRKHFESLPDNNKHMLKLASLLRRYHEKYLKAHDTGRGYKKFRIYEIVINLAVEIELLIRERTEEALTAAVTAARIEEATLWMNELAQMQYDEINEGVPQSAANKGYVEWGKKRLLKLKAARTNHKETE